MYTDFEQPVKPNVNENVFWVTCTSKCEKGIKVSQISSSKTLNMFLILGIGAV